MHNTFSTLMKIRISGVIDYRFLGINDYHPDCSIR